MIFGFDVPIAITEKLRVTGRRELKEPWTQTVIDYEGTGILELRIGDYAHGVRIRDRKRHRLEDVLATCVAGLMREARGRKLRAEHEKPMEIVRQKKAVEMAELRHQIEEE